MGEETALMSFPMRRKHAHSPIAFAEFCTK